MKRFLVVRVPEGCLQPEEIRRGSPALRETALSCPMVTKKLCYISLRPRILCGIFCVLAERTEMKRFLVVRVPEGCLQPEEIRRESGRKQKNEA